MLAKELENKIGEVIEYWEVNGLKITHKKARISKNTPYWYYLTSDGVVTFILIDKLGRIQSNNSQVINVKAYENKNYVIPEYSCGKRFYFSEESAYKYVIEKLKDQRQEINKRMVELQKYISFKDNN